MPVGVTSDLPAIEKAQDFSFKIPSLQHFVGKKKKKKIWLQQLLQCYCKINAAQMKDDECLFTRGLHKSLENTHMRRRLQREKHPQMQNVDKHTSEDTLLNVFFFFFLLECKRQPIRETDGIIFYHGDCS